MVAGRLLNSPNILKRSKLSFYYQGYLLAGDFGKAVIIRLAGKKIFFGQPSQKKLEMWLNSLIESFCHYGIPFPIRVDRVTHVFVFADQSF